MLFAVAIALESSAEDLPFAEWYNKNLYEGEDVTIGFGELDTVSFSYYGANYSVRVLSIYSTSATVRVGSKALDMPVGELREFELDGDGINDLNITLVALSSAKATLNLALAKLPEEEDEPEANTTASNQNSTNSTTPSQQNSSSAPRPASGNSSAPKTSAPKQSQTSQQPSGQAKPGAEGDVVYNINIDISIPPGSGIGVLLIVAIVLGGLVAYKKVRKRLSSEDEEIGNLAKEKQPKEAKKPGTVGEDDESSWKERAKKSLKRVARKVGRLILKLRLKLAELIAGNNLNKIQKAQKKPQKKRQKR